MQRMNNILIIDKVQNQKGFVLILTMVMLAILSILGVMVLNTTDTELSITSNYRAASDAFVGAELVMEFSQDKILKERSTWQLDEFVELPDLLPAGVALLPSAESINEIDFYTGPPPRRLAAGFSVDITSRGNIFRTTATGESGSPLPYYRTTVETIARDRSTARLEAVQVDLSGL